MAIIPGVTVNWALSPRIIKIPAPLTEATIFDLQDTLLDLEDDEVGIAFPFLRKTSGGENLGSGVTVGWTMQLQNAQIQFESRTTALCSGVATANDPTGTILTNSAAQFVTDGIYRGCTMFNATTGAMASIVLVISDTQLQIEPLSGGSRATWEIGDTYLVYPNVQCGVTGGNLVAVDENGDAISPIMQSPNVQILLTSSSSATNQNSLSIEHSSFNGGQGVSLDQLNGYTGTDGLQGSTMFPSKTIAEAKSIVAKRGLPNAIFVVGAITVGATESIEDYTIYGKDSESTPMNLIDGCVTINSILYNVHVSGFCGGRMSIHKSHINDIHRLDATSGGVIIEGCRLEGDIQFSSTSDMLFSFDDCSGGIGIDTPKIDVNNCTATVQFTNYIGIINLKNISQVTQNIAIDCPSGHLILESSVTKGNISLRGNAKYTNQTLPNTDLSIDTSGLQVPVIQQYNGRIYVSTDGTAGADYPYGLIDTGPAPNRMSNNMADAKTLARMFNCNDIHIHSDMTLTSADSLAFYLISGHKDYVLTLEAGCSTENLKFEGITVTGTMNGHCEFKDCILTDLVGLDGDVDNCTFDGAISISTSGNVHMSRCRSFTQNPVQIDVGTGTINAGNMIGMFQLNNKTGNNECNMHFDFGYIIVSNTNISGNIFLVGNGILGSNMAGGTIVNNNMAYPTNNPNWDTVWIDTVNGVTGQEYPKGSAVQPVSNLVDAVAIAQANNIDKYSVTGEIVLDRPFVGVKFLGPRSINDTIIDLNNQEIDAIIFENCVVSGRENAIQHFRGGDWARLVKVQFNNVYLKNIEDLQGIASHCQLEGTTLMKPGGWFSGIEIVVEGDNTTIDMRSTSGTTVSMDMNSGWAQFLNSTSGCLIELNVKGGEVDFSDISNIGGNYYLEGVGNLYGNDNMTLIENHFIWDDPISYHTVTGSTGYALGNMSAGSDPIAIADAVRTNLAAELARINTYLTPTQEVMLVEMYTLFGLDPTKPLTVELAERRAGAIRQSIATDPSETTVVTRI